MRDKLGRFVKGQKLSKEIKQKMKGRIPWNKGTKGIMKAWNKGMVCPQFQGENNGMFGKKHTESAKALIKLKRVNQKFSETTRKKMSESHKGDKSYNWSGGRKKDSYGYILIYKPKHPNTCKNFIREHRFVMEIHLKRYLTEIEIVHHIDEDKENNQINNLMLFPNRSKHIKHHKLMGGNKYGR